MKLSNLNLGLIALFFLLLNSCSKSDDEKPSPTQTPPEAESGKLTAEVGQNTFTSEEVFARYRSTGELTISATTSEDETLFFVLDNFVGALDYSFSPNLPNTARYSYQYNGNTQMFSTADGGSGVLTVTEFNEAEQKITGEFTLTVLQTTNLGNSLQITEGTFTDVSIKPMAEPQAGTIAYYADDVFYSTTNPDLTISPLLEVLFELPAPNGDLDMRLISFHADFATDVALMQSGFVFYELAISDFSLTDGKISVKLKNLADRDFELWINDYPIDQPYQATEPGVLTFYTDTATFATTSITIINFENNNNAQKVIFSSVNSNQTNVFSSVITNYESSLSLQSGNSVPFPYGGEGRVIFDDSGTAISYLAFVSQDSSLVMVGRDIPL